MFFLSGIEYIFFSYPSPSPSYHHREILFYLIFIIFYTSPSFHFSPLSCPHMLLSQSHPLIKGGKASLGESIKSDNTKLKQDQAAPTPIKTEQGITHLRIWTPRHQFMYHGKSCSHCHPPHHNHKSSHKSVTHI